MKKEHPHLILKPFSELSLEDPFFSSLRNDYIGFDEWFKSKSVKGEKAFVTIEQRSLKLQGFLYLKIEEGTITDVEPVLPALKRMKIGTFKIDAHGTSLGQYYISTLLRKCMESNVKEAYVTIFEKHKYLVSLLKKYGFLDYGHKITQSGTELVLLKSFTKVYENILYNFPRFKLNNRAFLLGIYPEFHSRLFPDSMLNTENPSETIFDVSYTNSIHKVYICKMKGVQTLQTGDILVIYRTKDEKRHSAYYSSVATSICVVGSFHNIAEYQDGNAFIQDISKYTVFTESELEKFYITRKYPFIIKMIYNAPLNKRITLSELVSKCHLTRDDYWGFRELTKQQLESILKYGAVSENFIIR